MKKINRNIGITIFKRTGILIKYPYVDLLKERVTATISIEEDVKMTVIVDLKLNTIAKEGCIDEILEILPDYDEDSYIEQIKHWAEVFIDNQITDPQAYFDKLL